MVGGGATGYRIIRVTVVYTAFIVVIVNTVVIDVIAECRSGASGSRGSPP